MIIYDSIDCLERKLFLYRQEDEDNIIHLQTFKEHLEVSVEVDMFKDTCCVNYEKKKTNHLFDKGAEKVVKDKRFAICFLTRPNMAIYGSLIRDLRDQYLLQQENYPSHSGQSSKFQE